MIKNNNQYIVKKIYNKLISSKKVTIIIHDNPDNDAYSSANGLAMFLIQYGIDARIMDVDMITSEFVRKFINPYLLEADMDFITGSTGIILDVGSAQMITSTKYLACSELLRIDHHIFCGAICENEWIDPEYSSTSEMIGHFILANDDYKMNRVISNALYPGILTDSGNLTYNTTQASTYELIAKFYEYDFDKMEIQQKLYQKNWSEIATDRALSGEVQVTEDNIAYLILTPELIEKYNVPVDDGKVYLMNNVLDFKVWFSLYWKPSKNSYKVSIRSHKYDVRQIAMKFGGGGHKLASAFYISQKEDFNLIIKYIRELMINE
ncbi:MAG: DHH family phosphoesterase [Mycoplasma sp.]